MSNNQQAYQRMMSGIVWYLHQELAIAPNRDYVLRQAVDTPRTIVVELAINPRHLQPILSRREALSMAAGLDRDQFLRIVRGRAGLLNLELPKPQQLWYHIGVNRLPPGKALASAVGLDQDQRPSLVNFANEVTAHVLIAGTTGSGKTNTEQLLVRNLATYNAPDQVKMVLIDVEKGGLRWRPFERLAHLAHPVVTQEGEARRVLTWLTAELDRRRTQGRQTPRLFVFVDELQALVQDQTAIGPIARIAQVGREFGLHFIGAVQNPTIENVGHPDIKRNLSARLVGRVSDGVAANVATGQKGSGADQLTGAGDFLVVQPGQAVRRVTIALLTRGDIARLPRRETPPCLPVEEVEDMDHVLAVSKGPGRPPDDYEWETVGHVVGELAERGQLNVHTTRRRFKLGLPKAERYLEAADGILGGLRQNGFEVLRVGTGHQGAGSREAQPLTPASHLQPPTSGSL